MAVRAVGLSWWREEDYARVREIMVDDVLPSTYAAWLQRAERQEREAQATGLTVIRIMAGPDDFLSWCRTAGLAPDAKARVAFAADRAMDQVKGTH